MTDWRDYSQYTPPEQMAFGASVHEDGNSVVIFLFILTSHLSPQKV